MGRTLWTMGRRVHSGVALCRVTIYSIFPMYWMVVSGVRAGHALYKPLPSRSLFREKLSYIFRLTDFPSTMS